MHYVPESARELLQENTAGPVADGEAARSFHYQSAPIYLLTAVVGLLLAADLVIGLVGDPAWSAYHSPFGFRLALLAAVLGGARILYQTLESLFEGRIGADLALTVAALAAIMLGEHVTAALVVFIALCGESIEGFTVDRARRAIRNIFNLCPKIAHVVRDGRERDLPVEEIVVGDTITIRPGERIPVDGTVTAGSSAVDQSALTGESLPVDKTSGDDVFTGTLNQFGSLSVVAEKVGAATTLAQVVKMVAEATERKAPLERTADRLARLFLPFVLGVAALTLIGWRLYSGEWSDGFRPVLGVLVVACPCALILATPTAVVAAMAWLARTGVVVKGSVALERLANVDTFAFDKTGTLTRGELTLGDVVTVGSLDETELLRVAAIAERRSEHLLARLIVAEAEARNCVVPEIDDFTAHAGSGVVARVRPTLLGAWASSGKQKAQPRDRSADEPHCTVVVGNQRLLEAQHIDIPAEVEQRLTELAESGQTVLLVAVEAEIMGVIGVRDTVRTESSEVLDALRDAQIDRFALLTGDRDYVAQSVAETLGSFDDIEAEMLPADKARWIEQQTKEGRRVAMVGDGVNDAPALATATVGLALGGVGSDIAAEAGDLVLMGDPLKPLPGLLRLSRQLVTNIRQSIVIFAFGMNFLGMLLCAVGILSPVGGAVFHECASLAVMLNAMRLLWFERWELTRLGRLTNLLVRFLEWLTAALSPSQIVFRILDNGRLLLRLGFAALMVYWLTTGLVLISEDEQALVSRFGRYETTLKAGWHWRWPVPFDRIAREKVDRVRSLQLGFRKADPSDIADEAVPRQSLIEWTSPHSEPGYETNPSESIILTGDEVPVELTAVVQYHVGDLYRFVYGSSQPESMLRAAAESSIREIAAVSPLDGILTDKRRGFEQRCLQLIRSRIDGYDLGIEVTDLNLLDVHPPREVVPAYRDVADAMEEREQRINEAEAYYAGKVLSAAGEQAIRILSTPVEAGKAGENQSTTGHVTDWTLDDELWKRLTRESESGDLALSGAAAATLLSAQQQAVKKMQAAEGAAARFESLMSAYHDNPSLTGSQMYWKTIEETLSSRPLTVIDPKVSGRQHLMLIDPYGMGDLRAFDQSFPQTEDNPPIDGPGRPENR